MAEQVPDPNSCVKDKAALAHCELLIQQDKLDAEGEQLISQRLMKIRELEAFINDTPANHSGFASSRLEAARVEINNLNNQIQSIKSCYQIRRDEMEKKELGIVQQFENGGLRNVTCINLFHEPRGFYEVEASTHFDVLFGQVLQWLGEAPPSKMYHLSSSYHTISSDFQLQRRICAEPSDTLTVLVTLVGLKRKREVEEEEEEQQEMDVDGQQVKKVKVSRVRWKPSEIHLLTKTVERMGKEDWDVIALGIPSRTASQCRLKWRDLQAKDSVRNSAVSSIADLSKAQAAMSQVLLMKAQQEAEQNPDEAKQAEE